MDFSASTLFAGLIFGSIGVVAFIYGRKQSEWKPMVIGALLFVYPYFIPSPIWQWVIGAVLTALFFIFK